MEKETIKTGKEIKNLLDVKHDNKHWYRVTKLNDKMFNGVREGDVVSFLMEKPINSILTIGRQDNVQGLMMMSLDFNDLLLMGHIELEYVGPRES